MAGWAGLFRPRPRKSGDKFLLHVFGSDPILALQPMGGGGGALESWGALKGFGMGSWGVGVCGVALGGGSWGVVGGSQGIWLGLEVWEGSWGVWGFFLGGVLWGSGVSGRGVGGGGGFGVLGWGSLCEGFGGGLKGFGMGSWGVRGFGVPPGSLGGAWGRFGGV